MSSLEHPRITEVGRLLAENDRLQKDNDKLRAENDRLREALKALEDAYRDVEMAMPPQQGKAAVLAWMKARAALG